MNRSVPNPTWVVAFKQIVATVLGGGRTRIKTHELGFVHHFVYRSRRNLLVRAWIGVYWYPSIYPCL
jgi:hypothetical protein